MFYCLLSKFTTQGEVELCVGLSEATDKNAVLLFAVRDTGIGFPEEKTELSNCIQI